MTAPTPAAEDEKEARALLEKLRRYYWPHDNASVGTQAKFADLSADIQDVTAALHRAAAAERERIVKHAEKLRCQQCGREFADWCAAAIRGAS